MAAAREFVSRPAEAVAVGARPGAGWAGSYAKHAAKKKAGACTGFSLAPEGASVSGFQLRWPLISLVISNIETWAFLKISFSLASALIIVRFAES